MLKKPFHPVHCIIVVLLTFFLTSCASSPTLESTGQYIDNSLITTKVKAQLFSEMQLESVEIKVKSFKDEVQLSGFVDSHQIKKQAERIAWSIPGVKKVRNDLIVKSDAG